MKLLTLLLTVIPLTLSAQFVPTLPIISKDSADMHYQLGKKSQQQKDPVEAARHYFIALQGFENADDLGKTYTRLGSVFFSLLMYGNAVDFFEKSAEIYLKSGEVEKLSNSHFNIGRSLYRLKKYSEAIPYYESALELFTEVGDQEKILATYHQMGVLYSTIASYDSAKVMFRDVLTSSNQSRVANAMNEIGFIYNLKGDNQQAREWYNKSLELKKSTGNLPAMTSTLNNLASIYESENKPEEAAAYYRKALAYLDTTDYNNPALNNTYLKLSYYYEHKDDIRTALAHSRMFEACAVSLFAKQEELKKLLLQYQGRLALMEIQYIQQQRDHARIQFILSLCIGILSITLIVNYIRKTLIKRKVSRKVERFNRTFPHSVGDI